MPYTVQTWVDNDITRPLSAARMNHIEAGILAAGGTTTWAGNIFAGSMITVRKDAATGFWPTSYNSSTGVPSYAGGSGSSGVRPTSDPTVTVVWDGLDPSPAIVASGTAGMQNHDIRIGIN